MLEYVKAKAAEYSAVLSWIDQELRHIDKQHPEHHPLIARLQAKLVATKSVLNYLNKIAMGGSRRRLLSLVWEIKYFILLATTRYLPPLQKEGETDRFLRKILLSIVKRYQLDWIEDITVHLNGEHGAFSEPWSETPLILAPPQHAASLADMPGLYHELGHNVLEKFPGITGALGIALSDYCVEMQKFQHDGAINDIQTYWKVTRLNELFCDIFATFVCGPAHYVSCIDMGLRLDRDPFQVDLEAAHPALSARVSVCYKSLDLSYNDEQMVILASNVWEEHEKSQLGNEAFDLVCPESLIDRLVEVSIQCIHKLLPATKRYSATIPQGEELLQIPEGLLLEDILNRGAKILLTCPEHYASWEGKIFELLKSAV